jgi:hypothetical protein
MNPLISLEDASIFLAVLRDGIDKKAPIAEKFLTDMHYGHRNIVHPEKFAGFKQKPWLFNLTLPDTENYDRLARFRAMMLAWHTVVAGIRSSITGLDWIKALYNDQTLSPFGYYLNSNAGRDEFNPEIRLVPGVLYLPCWCSTEKRFPEEDSWLATTDPESDESKQGVSHVIADTMSYWLERTCELYRRRCVRPAEILSEEIAYYL